MSEVTIEELRAKGQVTEHTTPGNVSYPDPGKLCPICGKCWFRSKRDLGLHMSVCEEQMMGWRKSDYYAGEEWCFSNRDPKLALAIKQQGPVTMNGRTVRLSGDGNIFLRKRAEV